MNVLNSLTENYVLTSSYDDISRWFGIIILLLVITAVLIRLVYEARHGAKKSELIAHSDILTIPLMTALAIIVLNRLLDLFPH